MTRTKLVCCLRRCGITGSASPVDGPAQAARPEQPNTAQAQAKDKGGKLYSKLNDFEKFTKYLVNCSKPLSLL